MEYVRKNITIRKDQKEWVDESDVNVSKIAQDGIDELMD